MIKTVVLLNQRTKQVDHCCMYISHEVTRQRITNNKQKLINMTRETVTSTKIENILALLKQN